MGVRRLAVDKTRGTLPWFISEPRSDIYRDLKGNPRPYAVVDIETTNIGKGKAIYDNRFLYGYVQYTNGISVEFDDISDYVQIAELCIEEGYIFVAHNAKFELQWLIREGVPVENLLVWDTMVAEKKILSNRPGRLDLDTVALRYGGKGKNEYIDKLMHSGVCPSEMPRSMLESRCRQDVEDTEKIFLDQLTYVYKHGIIGAVFTGNLAVSVIADTEMNGLYLDRDLVIQLYREENLEYNSVIEQLNEIAPINYSSPQQVAKLLFEDLKFAIPKKNGRELRGKPSKAFPEGTPQTNEDAIALLKPKTKKQKRFIELKKEESRLRKKLTTYHKLFVDAIENNNCYLYGNINQTITNTQRLSSNGPNLQNMDRSLKKVFTARNPGWLLRQDDYSQLEYRVAGFMGQCPVAYKDIMDGVDVHELSTNTIFDVDKEHPEYKEYRNNAKPHTFKPLYGGQSGTDKEKEYYQKFMEKHTGIKAWHDKLLDEAWRTKQLIMPTGLVFYFPGCGYNDNGYFVNQTNIKNYPVQYLATGEIAIIGYIFLWHRLKQNKLQTFIVNEVHDAVISEQHPDEVEEVNELAQQAMIDDVLWYLWEVYGVDFNFPLEIETDLNSNWGYDHGC